MAQTVITTDDLDGSPNAETVAFSFHGTSYTIDLAKKNRLAFEKTLKPYIAAAQKEPGRRRRTASTRRAGSTRQARPSQVDTAAVRSWAQENGVTVSTRGRIAEAVIEQYKAAH